MSSRYEPTAGDCEGITLRQYAAIHLRVEHPDLPAWLNEMIRKARRDEFAKAALAGLLADNEGTFKNAPTFAKQLADAMLAKEGK